VTDEPSDGEVTVRDERFPSSPGSSPGVTDTGDVAGTGSVRSLDGSVTRTSIVPSPVEALLLAAVGRTRNFLYIVYAICALMLGMLPVLSGSPIVEIALAVAIGICAALAAYLHLAIRDPDRYTGARVLPVAWWTAVTSSIAVLFWGVFSPAPIAVVMGMYFFCRAQSLGGAVLIYATCAGLQGLFAGLVIAGAFTDPGLLVPADMPLHELVLTQLMVQVIFLFTFLMARGSRRAELHSIEQLRLAMRQVSQREALLQEARFDLDRALRVGGPGRYTDQVLDGFELGAVIGRGAMGEIYEATHLETGSSAAIKLLHPHVRDDPQVVERFLREARAAGALQVPNVVRIVGASGPEAPVPYLAMERLHGHDLTYYLRRRRRLSAAWTVELAEQVGTVIDAARSKGIVHRDLKPQNLFRAEYDGGGALWKVLDFGVSKLGEHSGTLTQGRVVGTPAYMAPEQARGREVDHRADLYALAAIVYRCVTGRPPFSGKDMPVILHEVVYTMPPRPGELADLEPDVELALAVGLAKRPADRFGAGSDLADAFELAFAGRLDEHTRRRGRALIGEMPWGKHHGRREL